MHQELALAVPLSPESPIQFEAIENDSITRILRATRKHLGTEIAFVGRYVEGDQRELMHVDTDLDLPMGAGFREPKENSFCWHILEGRLPSLIQDAADYPLAKTLPVTNMLPVGCHLNVPLRLSDGSVFGSFCCVSRQPNRTITERDIDVLKAFGQLAAELIEGSLAQDEENSSISKSIDDVISANAVSVVMQPIHHIENGAVAGFECLTRFADTKARGPDVWFNNARSVGKGVMLETLAVARALEAARRLPEEVYISVNASPETILSGSLEELLASFVGPRIVLEVTEHERVIDYAALGAALRKISPYARIAIDDVGAGYAGLRHLVDLAPDILKLDISLTTNIDTDIARQAMATAIVHFADAIGSEVVAEGIETEDQLRTLRSLGVGYGQGYHYAKPMPLIAASQYLLKSRF
ncbi:EAL domain-containing protein [Alteriqipengyuania sp.]|uniref:sensor domain-containing phosphodiesterase n=1 Tax=Alteriqipengyuania sp. TaxID=2800692 RepID=UPI003515C462